MPDLNEYILEIRHKPNSKFIDCRGSWAEKISNHMGLSEWGIVANRIDIYDQNSANRAFVSYRNIGFVSRDVPTISYFPGQAIKYIKYLFTLENFQSNPYIERIGVRAKFCREFKGNHEELTQKYMNNYLNLTKKAKKVLNSKIIDIGGAFNLADEYGNFNTKSGPMVYGQLIKIFNRSTGDKQVPKIGLYYDIDYWVKPGKYMHERDIINHISIFSKSTWDRYIKISKLILSEG